MGSEIKIKTRLGDRLFSGFHTNEAPIKSSPLRGCRVVTADTPRARGVGHKGGDGCGGHPQDTWSPE